MNGFPGGGGGAVWSKPPGLVCHICGREYGTTSLQIHVPQCAKKWKDQQKLLPRSERRPLPKAPMSITDMQAMKVDTGDVDAMERFNKQQMAAYTEQGLVQCQHCGRKFLQEKLPVHQRSCTAERPAAAVGSHRLKQGEPPKTTASASAIASTISPSYLSKSSPEESKTSDDIIVPSKGYDLSQLPPPDMSSADASGLVPCSLCGRKFNTDRVGRHEAVCTKSQVHTTQRPQTSLPPPPSSTGAPASAGKWKTEHNEFIKSLQYAKKLSQMQKAGVNIASLPPPPPAANLNYVECPHCQRRFNPTAAERHIPACAMTINKPKPPPQRRPITAAVPSSSAAVSGGSTGMGGGGKGFAPQKLVTRTGGASGGGLGTKVGVAKPSGGGGVGGGVGFSGGANGGDLQNQVQQLTATVALLAQQMSSGRGAPGGGLPAISGALNSARGGREGGSGVAGGACKACSASLSPSARYCAQCGAPQQ